MTYIYSDEQFTAAMREAVAERGADWRYPSDPAWRNGNNACVYSLPTGEPACLIGLALYKIDPKLMPGHEDIGSANDVMRDLGFGGLVCSAATSAQGVQDRGERWGDALDCYFHEMGISTE